VHPVSLPSSDKDAAPFYNERVSLEVEKKNGPPKKGDFFVCRGDDAWNPIWVGVIASIINANDCIMEEEEEEKEEEGKEEKKEEEVKLSKGKRKNAPKGKGSRSRSTAVTSKLSTKSDAASRSRQVKYKVDWYTFIDEKSLDLSEQSWETYLRSQRVESSSQSSVKGRTEPSLESASSAAKSGMVTSIAAAASTSSANNDSHHIDVWEEWKKAKESISAGIFARLPEVAIERLRHLKYAKDKKKKKGEVSAPIPPEALVCWGEKKQILKEDNTLRKWAFDRIKEDWVESKDSNFNMLIDHTAEHNNRMQEINSK
jgi:hypothetical protein